MDWDKIDKAMTAKLLNDPQELVWHDPALAPFRVSGLYWFEREKRYLRFPAASMETLKAAAPGAHSLSRHMAGAQIAFQTDSARIAIAAKLTGAHTMDHFAATGECGMDLYAAYPGEAYHFESVTRYPCELDNYACEMLRDDERHMKRVIVNLPLYDGVEALNIGLSEGAKLLPPEPWANDCPIVFYGTSITQGGCASRPGMLYTNILSRRLNREFLNFGFSGSGKGEPEVARLLAQIQEPALYALAYEANAEEKMYSTLDPFIDILRAAHPETPIIVCSRLFVQQEAHQPALRKKRDDLRAFQRDTVERRAKAGDGHISFVDGTTLLGDAPEECFVDGVHPTDLGFWRIADSLEPIIRRYL